MLYATINIKEGGLMLEKLTIDIKEFKGHPYLEIISHSIANGKGNKKKNLTLRFGYTKCNMILDAIEKIQDFVYAENDKKIIPQGDVNG